MAEGVYDPSLWPTGRRRYLMATCPHSLLSTRRLHSERHAFRNLAHMLDYWLFDLYSAAIDATLEAGSSDGDGHHAAKVADEIDMVKMLAAGAELSAHETETLVHRALDAGQAAAKSYLATGTLDDSEFYPWFIPGEWGTGVLMDTDRAAELAGLEKRVADRQASYRARLPPLPSPCWAHERVSWKSAVGLPGA